MDSFNEVRCINVLLVEYKQIYDLLKFIVTAIISIAAIWIGGKRLKDLTTYYKKQRFNAAFGYYTIIRRYSVQLKTLIEDEPSFWELDCSDAKEEETENIANYRNRLIEFSKDFLKFFSGVNGQTPLKDQWLCDIDALCQALTKLSNLHFYNITPKLMKLDLLKLVDEFVNMTSEEIEYAAKVYMKGIAPQKNNFMQKIKKRRKLCKKQEVDPSKN